MANDLDAAAPVLLAQGLVHLRENTIMPTLVKSDFGITPQTRGSSVPLWIPGPATVEDVVPSATAPDSPDIILTERHIELNQWKKSSFTLSDKEVGEVMDGVVPAQATTAVASLANTVDNYILSLYTGVYGFAGVAGTTPFSADTTEASAARGVLNKQLAPLRTIRSLVLDGDAEENALNLTAFQNTSFGVSVSEIKDGRLPRKLGFDWLVDQNIPTHTNSGGSGWLVNQADHAADDTVVTIGTGSGDPAVGDIFTVAGETQTFVVESYAGNAITYAPAAPAAFTNTAAITFKPDHVVNLGFDRNAFGFVNRPMQVVNRNLGVIVESAQDGVSGLSMRLVIKYENYQTKYSFDILFGAELVRPELAVRLAG